MVGGPGLRVTGVGFGTQSLGLRVQGSENSGTWVLGHIAFNQFFGNFTSGIHLKVQGGESKGILFQGIGFRVQPQALESQALNPLPPGGPAHSQPILLRIFPCFSP